MLRPRQRSLLAAAIHQDCHFQVMGQKCQKVGQRGHYDDDDHDDNEFDGGGNDCADDDDADAIGGG